MSDEKDVFAWFGAASYCAQCVEQELWIARLFLLRDDNVEPTDEAWEQFESEKLTMSGLLGLVKCGIAMDIAEIDALEDCREKRNWLAHAYWKERTHLLISSEGCAQAVEELANLCEVLKKGDEVARGVSARIRAKVGISEKWVRETEEEYLQRLQAGEPSKAILQDMEERMKRLSARVPRDKGVQS